MSEKEYLSEERYNNTKKKLRWVAVIVLIVGFLLGGGVIAVGIINQNEVDDEYSEESKAEIVVELEAERQNLLSLKGQLESEITPVREEIKQLERVEFTGFNDEYYARKDRIEELENSIADSEKEINMIDGALAEVSSCVFTGSYNAIISKYCSLKNDLEGFDDTSKTIDSFKNIPFYMFGVFIILAGCLISVVIFVIIKRREIVAFGTQQVMPVAKEGIEKMAPTIGSAAKTIAKDIKSALKDDKNKNEEDEN